MTFKTFAELEKHISSNNLFGRACMGTADTGEQIFFSKGVQLSYKDINEPDIKEALQLFLNGNYGGFYDWNEEPTPNKEYGEYKSKWGDTYKTGAIMIHREKGTIVIYFQFER